MAWDASVPTLSGGHGTRPHPGGLRPLCSSRAARAFEGSESLSTTDITRVPSLVSLLRVY